MIKGSTNSVRKISDPERVLVSVREPSKYALIKVTIFVLGTLHDQIGQVFDPNHETTVHGRCWQGGYFAIKTMGNGLYVAVPPTYARSTDHSGSILDVFGSIQQGTAVTQDTDSSLPPIEIGEPWAILPEAGPIDKVVAVATEDTQTGLPNLKRYRQNELISLIDNTLTATLGATAFTLAVRSRQDRERAEEVEARRLLRESHEAVSG